jgi:hypothetical protein
MEYICLFAFGFFALIMLFLILKNILVVIGNVIGVDILEKDEDGNTPF